MKSAANSRKSINVKEEIKASFPSSGQIPQEKGGSNPEIEPYYEWHSIDPNGQIFTPRTGHTVVNFNHKAFLFGGIDNDKKSNDLFEFDILNKTWRMLPTKGQVPTARSGSKSVVSKDLVYYFGGYVSKDGEYFNDLRAFNPANNEWKLLPINGESITPRVDHTMVVFGHSLYIFAGTTQKNILNDLYKINLETLKCKKIKGTGDIPTLRFGHTSDVYQNSMYVFGGWNGYDTLGEFFAYSFISNIWYEEKLLPGSKPPSRYRHASAIIGNSLFIFGGVDKTQVKYNDLYEFNFEYREWRYIDTTGLTPTPRTFHQLISFDNKLFLFGGSDTQKKNDVHYISTNSDPSKDGIITEVSDVSHMLFLDSEHKIKFIEENNQSEDKAHKIVKLLNQQVEELKHRLKCEQERNTCAGCQEKEINSVFLNCGHRCMCYNCAVRNFKCPICGQDVVRVVKVFTI